MRRIISFKVAGNWAFYSLILLVLFHLGVLLGLQFTNHISYEYLWGGRMKSEEQLFYFEVASLLMSMVFLSLVMVRTERLQLKALKGLSRVAMWVLFVLFLLNTVGNLMATSTFEKYFSIFTALLTLLFLRLALGSKPR